MDLLQILHAYTLKHKEGFRVSSVEMSLCAFVTLHKLMKNFASMKCWVLKDMFQNMYVHAVSYKKIFNAPLCLETQGLSIKPTFF